jgi:hypothetical protein
METTTLIAIIAAIPPTLAAIAAMVVGIMNHVQGAAIHILVNSNLDKANEKIASLEILLTKLVNEKAAAEK